MEAPLSEGLPPMTGQVHADAARSKARQVVVLKVLVAIAFAILIPSPFGGWPPISLLLWGLVGDPQSGVETLAFIGGGAALLALYTTLLFGAIALVTRAVAFILRTRGRTKRTS